MPNIILAENDIINEKSLNGKNLYYLFYNDKYKIPALNSKIYTFKKNLLEDILILSIGICDKK